MNSARYWAVVPAAGVGKRMASAIPKQYLPLAGVLVIEQTLQRLLSHPKIETVFVALSEQDGWWPDTSFADDARVMRVAGGAERCHSVLNALDALSVVAAEEDWVLVHDAARPCLRLTDLDRLINQTSSHAVGGLLGIPVRDTMKRSDRSAQVTGTVPREQLWHAFTPQMFRLGPLRSALKQALDNGELVTDEASAMELAGLRPLMVEGHADNIKITRPEDLALAAFFLQQQ
ncbi:MAG: 2-C-methyl-D-erythritol 4-phosphate cytidylyltransferase [Candidatus Polarisedimenticolaceae bacterium]|nr:2-C-methyl-D-erythritol 4-phosphate cytidylyltransferase [Candidatus Polarisedimenticolaceae bacterium]